MQNVREGQLKKCIFLTESEFLYAFNTVFADRDVRVEFNTCEGIYFENISTGEVCEEMAKYFDVPLITSIHIDHCEYIGVWICYREIKEL